MKKKLDHQNFQIDYLNDLMNFKKVLSNQFNLLNL